ncbi:MAG: hypothetical protein M3Q73_00325 [bacterium]|nr:hypothetical protein [bacterium]
MEQYKPEQVKHNTPEDLNPKIIQPEVRLEETNPVESPAKQQEREAATQNRINALQEELGITEKPIDSNLEAQKNLGEKLRAVEGGLREIEGIFRYRDNKGLNNILGPDGGKFLKQGLSDLEGLKNMGTTDSEKVNATIKNIFQGIDAIGRAQPEKLLKEDIQVSTSLIKQLRNTSSALFEVGNTLHSLDSSAYKESTDRILALKSDLIPKRIEFISKRATLTEKYLRGR